MSAPLHNLTFPYERNFIRYPLLNIWTRISRELVWWGEERCNSPTPIYTPHPVPDTNVIQYRNFYVTDGNIMYLTDASSFLISCGIQHYAPVVGWGEGGTDA